MADEFDPCECVFSHDNAMQRLINLLRSSQTQCTDNECISDLPGGLQGITPPQGGDYSFFLIMMGWVLLALALFFMRPNTMRNPTDGKSNNNNGPSTPPPDAIF